MGWEGEKEWGGLKRGDGEEWIGGRGKRVNGGQKGNKGTIGD